MPSAEGKPEKKTHLAWRVQGLAPGRCAVIGRSHFYATDKARSPASDSCPWSSRGLLSLFCVGGAVWEALPIKGSVQGGVRLSDRSARCVSPEAVAVFPPLLGPSHQVAVWVESSYGR